MKKPLVSVILPVYNVEEYLEECFLSVKNQTYKNIEIIIVDDGATDGSGKLADDLAKTDKRATVIHKKNGGLSDARNAGMKKAQGEYITFVDSDDWISRVFVENLINEAMAEGADIAQCNNSRDLSEIDAGSKGTVAMPGKDAFVELMKYKTISPTAWGKLYKTSLFRRNDLVFPVGRIHEDTAILYKLIYLANKVVCLDSALYYYRLNANSIMTASYTERHYESVAQYHKELDDFILSKSINLDSQILSKHKALRILSVLNKLALNAADSKDVYRRFRVEYIKYSISSRSPICAIGAVPVSIPVIFRISRRTVPLVRRVMGKT